VAFSPDGTRVVTASYDGKARVWDAATGRLVAMPFEHTAPVVAATFGRAGMQVMTAGLDKVARVWALAMDAGSLEAWRRLARCGTFVIAGTVPIANPAPSPTCNRPGSGGR
jgi:WD40 repeat protein